MIAIAALATAAVLSHPPPVRGAPAFALFDLQGEKLKAGERLLGPNAQKSSEILAGWFILSARDEEQAIEIARNCPHLAHDGTISVREIDGT